MGEHIDKTKGKIKKTVGAVTGDTKLEREGERDEAKGRVQGAVKDVKSAAQEVKKSVKPVGK